MKLLNKIGIAIVVILVVLVTLIVNYETKFVSMADDFFAAIAKKDESATRSFLPNNGSGANYAALFSDLVPQGAVLNFKADPLMSQKGLLFSKDKTVTGTINPEGAPKPIPVTVQYVTENGVWKIQEVREDVEKGKPTAAEEQEKAKIMAITRQAMADFILSKKSKSMEHFYSTISDTWKKDTTVKKLDKSFEPIINDPTDWSFLNPVEPSITKYAVNKDGVLTIIGVYPSKPKRLIFEQNFVNESNVWKLVGFKLYTADAEPAPTDGKSSSGDAKKLSTTNKSSTATKTTEKTKK